MDDRPRIAIGTWPTPVMRLPVASRSLGTDVWAKLEDGCGAWGGNKVRKLEYILGSAEADGIQRLVSFGAGTSNWTSALAFHACRRGFDVEVRLSANEAPATYDRLYREVGARVVRRGSLRWYAEANLSLIRPDRGRTRFVPLGGSGPAGNAGSVHAGTEIAAAVHEGVLPAPRKLFAACGTGGTAAGVAVGAALGGLSADVVCVRVTPRPYGTRTHVRLAARSLRKSVGDRRRAGCRIVGDGSQAAPGYARSNPRSLEAAQIAALDGLVLDQTYGAKAFASLVAHARRGEPGPYLFLHTSPGDPPSAGPEADA